MDEKVSSFPCPTLFTDGYGLDSEEMSKAFETMQIELVISEIVRTIEIKELDLGRIFRQTLSQQNLCSRPRNYPMGIPAINPPVIENASFCNRCGHSRSIIEARGNGMDFLEYRHMHRSDTYTMELICQSCCYEEGVDCIDCGMSEPFALNQRLPPFMEDQEVWPRNWRCDGCWARRERFQEALTVRNEAIDQRIIQRLNNLQQHPQETDGFEEDDATVDYLITLPSEDATYIGEYENEDWQPENNTEKVKAIKDTVKKIGEIGFEFQEKIPEGAYLELMNNLQELTNCVNQL